MIVFAILGSLAAIGVLCWLLFTLAVFAFPALHRRQRGHLGPIQTGAGLARCNRHRRSLVPVSHSASASFLLAVLRPVWLKLLDRTWLSSRPRPSRATMRRMES